MKLFPYTPYQDGCQLCTGSSSIFHCVQSCLWYAGTVCYNNWAEFIPPLDSSCLHCSFLPHLLCSFKEINTAMTQSSAPLLQALCMQSCRDLRAGQTSPNAGKALSACVAQVVSVQQRYPARELKFQENSLSETKSMYKSSSNINLSQAKLFFKHLPTFTLLQSFLSSWCEFFPQ